MNTLSLFDGMSAGHLALVRAGVKIDNYFASEIDKFAIKVTMANFPDTIQLGSVINVDISKLPKIDLLIGGSPCQSFSFAGKRKGMITNTDTEITTLNQYLKLKEDGFEFEGQSYLFWEYVRVLNNIQKVNPNILFLLENVRMEEKWESIISETLQIKPIAINSSLVSAQNRYRLYWTNINTKSYGLFGDNYCIIPQPEDKKLLLKDILENNVDEKYYLNDKALKGILEYNKNQTENNRGFSAVFHGGGSENECL